MKEDYRLLLGCDADLWKNSLKEMSIFMSKYKGENNMFKSSVYSVYSLAEATPNKIAKSDLIPVKIIYNDKSTICYFKDGSKEIVHCAEGEQFIKEVGVMSCIMKKLFNSRNGFKRLVESGYEQPKKTV